MVVGCLSACMIGVVSLHGEMWKDGRRRAFSPATHPFTHKHPPPHAPICDPPWRLVSWSRRSTTSTGRSFPATCSPGWVGLWVRLVGHVCGCGGPCIARMDRAKPLPTPPPPTHTSTTPKNPTPPTRRRQEHQQARRRQGLRRLLQRAAEPRRQLRRRRRAPGALQHGRELPRIAPTARPAAQLGPARVGAAAVSTAAGGGAGAGLVATGGEQGRGAALVGPRRGGGGDEVAVCCGLVWCVLGRWSG